MSTLMRWKKSTPVYENQLKPFLGLHRTIEEALNNFYNVFDTETTEIERFENRNIFPAMDITETDSHFTIEVEMPGMGEEDIKIMINDDRLSIHGEKSTSKKHKDKKYISREINYGSYNRTINLPPSADANKAKATFKKGMLWVEIPKKEEEDRAESREIKVESV